MKVEGGQQLRELTVELKAADRALLLAMRRNLRAIAKPAAAAVQAEERRVLPKKGGLNEYVAEVKPSIRILTGTRTAGVVLRQGKTSRLSKSNWYLANNQGMIRHPNRGGPRRSVERRDVPGGWSTTPIHVTGWFERPLLAMAPEAMTAMKAVMDETARAAGFR